MSKNNSRYLLSVLVDLCFISTDTTLDENEIIRIYGKRWDIEVFFKVCKSHLNLSRECDDNRSLGELFLYFSDELIAFQGA